MIIGVEIIKAVNVNAKKKKKKKVCQRETRMKIFQNFNVFTSDAFYTVQ